MDIKSYIVDKGISVKEISKRINKDGVLLIENFIDLADLELLNNEFDKALSAEENSYLKKLNYSVGKGAKLRRSKLNANAYPVTNEVFSSSWMKSICNDILGWFSLLNFEIYVVNDVVGSDHGAMDMHFDVTRNLKFFIYLTDTKKANGAFTCVPGTHKKTVDIRKKLGKDVNYENLSTSRPTNYLPEEELCVEGGAGTLIIFDTDVYHKAGHVSEGERRVMRGHCVNQPEYIIPFYSKFKKIFS